MHMFKGNFRMEIWMLSEKNCDEMLKFGFEIFVFMFGYVIFWWYSIILTLIFKKAVPGIGKSCQEEEFSSNFLCKFMSCLKSKFWM